MGSDSGRTSGRGRAYWADEQKGSDSGRTSGRADMGGHARWTSRWGRTSCTDGWTGINKGGHAGRTGCADGQTGVDLFEHVGRTRGRRQARWTAQMRAGKLDGRAHGVGRCWMDRPKDKTPQLTHQLTWPLEIQCVRPRINVKIGHSPPPSR